jgi:broad specificity phosphatase PhoE
MTCLLLIRHGQTEWNVEGRYQGQKDPPLNDTGIEQAHSLAKNLCDFHTVYTSPLQRCLQTAKIIAGSQTIHSDHRLMEINQGLWEGQLYRDIVASHPVELDLWENHPWQFSPPGGENLRQVQARVIEAIEDIRLLHSGQTIVVVTHQLPLRIIKITYEQLTEEEIFSVSFPNSYHELLEIHEDFQPSFHNEFRLPDEKIF